jgi:hypothetical protein
MGNLLLVALALSFGIVVVGFVYLRNRETPPDGRGTGDAPPGDGGPPSGGDGGGDGGGD